MKRLMLAVLAIAMCIAITNVVEARNRRCQVRRCQPLRVVFQRRTQRCQSSYVRQHCNSVCSPSRATAISAGAAAAAVGSAIRNTSDSSEVPAPIDVIEAPIDVIEAPIDVIEAPSTSSAIPEAPTLDE